MAFSGGTYEEVGRWLGNFLRSHAKREDARAEVELEAGDERKDKSYGARVRLGAALSPLVEFDYRHVADNRGSLAWCRGQADELRRRVRELRTGRATDSAAR